MTGRRWESYQTVEVQVPDDWSWGTTNRPPCLVDKLGPPYVGRPGAIRAKGCRDPYPPLPYRTSYLWFDADARKRGRVLPVVPPSGPAREPGVRPPDHGWTEETRVVDGVYLTVFSDDDALRHRILDSARPIDGLDAYGCPPDHPLAEPTLYPIATSTADARAHPPTARPADTGGLPAPGAVESITVCRYAIRNGRGERRAPLIASSRLAGPEASALVAAILEAPEGYGPEDLSCIDILGAELIVLKVRADGLEQEVLVRYAGCHFNGTDDGGTRRQLSAAVVRPLLRGIHHQTSYNHQLYEMVKGIQR
ncbi:hypothetical protein [Kribbella sp. NPDC051770]|uniref:hypothetical protein n=1 Tax=Kribbella sp. NPDC051770 TaxID=3155413 RepID=UPI003438EF7D